VARTAAPGRDARVCAGAGDLHRAGMAESERLTRLEERYAHLQRHITEQDKAVLELGEEVARLKKELARLRVQLTALPDPGAEPPEARPPHH
jgi:SlyX protein